MPSTVLGVGNGQSPDSYEDYFLVVGQRKQVIIYQVMCVMEENRGIRSISVLFCVGRSGKTFVMTFEKHLEAISEQTYRYQEGYYRQREQEVQRY